MPDHIKTQINCSNLAPIENLYKEIQSNSLKIGVFANNGSGKTFISRMFRLTENQEDLGLEEDGTSPTDKLISLGKSESNFAFKVIDKEGVVKEDFSIKLKLGDIPTITETNYIFHTFNQDYVEDNIRALGYEKDSEIEGFILGKANIDLKEDEAKLTEMQEEGRSLVQQVNSEINQYLIENINDVQNIKRLNEYKNLTFDKVYEAIDDIPLEVSKPFDELLEDYNKIKAVPDTLKDIERIEPLNLDFEKLDEIKNVCNEEFSLSSLANDFKNKIQSKQDFVELGMDLIAANENKTQCPFCEQKLENEAIKLIDNYTKYLTDTEAKVKKKLWSFISSLNGVISLIEGVQQNNKQAILDFHEYVTKYIPSSAKITLVQFKIETLVNIIKEIIKQVEIKLEDISQSVNIDQEFINEIEKLQALINHKIENNNSEIDTLNYKKNRINDENRNTRKEICNSAFNYLVDEHNTNIKNIRNLRKEYSELKEEVKKKKEQEKVSKKEKVADTIKTVLNCFFDNKYTLDSDNFRLIFNSNTLAKNQAKNVLSEGEKNVIAFAYYIGDSHLKIESEDDYKKLFFVIDDPISSMDFTHVYSLSGMIRDLDKILTKIERVKLLLFTHNNDFMRVLTSNNIVDKRLLLKGNELKEFNHNLTVPYISHLIDIYNIARNEHIPNHTTANSIRHIIETLTKFENIDTSRDSIAKYIREKVPTETRAYTLINDLSHGGWRTEQAPITDEDYRLMCSTIIDLLEDEFKGQIEYCEKTCV